MNFKPWFGWARNGPCVRRNTNSTYVPPSSYKTTFRIDMYSFTHLWYRMKKVNICCCCMSIICRSRLAKAKQNAWFGFMLITAQYAPEMKSDHLCLFDQFMYFGSATQKLCHIFRLFRLRFQLFEEFFGCLIFWGTSATWALLVIQRTHEPRLLHTGTCMSTNRRNVTSKPSFLSPMSWL